MDTMMNDLDLVRGKDEEQIAMVYICGVLTAEQYIKSRTMHPSVEQKPLLPVGDFKLISFSIGCITASVTHQDILDLRVRSVDATFNHSNLRQVTPGGELNYVKVFLSLNHLWANFGGEGNVSCCRGSSKVYVLFSSRLPSANKSFLLPLARNPEISRQAST